MFFIIIGQSGAGKTTFVKRNFLQEETSLHKGDIYYTRCGSKVALGKYGIGIRTEGTDTLSYSAKAGIKKQLKKFAETGKDVVLEGDRINNREIFEYIAALGVEARLYLITCSVATSMKRLRAAGSTITPTFVKATKTKSKKMFLEYGGRFHGKVIKTD